MRDRSDDKPKGGAPAWMSTYSDAMTLLMAFFVILLTFASPNSEDFEQFKQSIIGHLGGTGLTRTPPPGPSRDSVVWRNEPPQARTSVRGSEMPPQNRDPSKERPEGVMSSLEEPQQGKMRDHHTLRAPLNYFINDQEQLTQEGKELLGLLGDKIKHLPFDILIRVGKGENLEKAALLIEHLFLKKSLHPGRLGIGTRMVTSDEEEDVWVSLVRRSRGSR